MSAEQIGAKRLGGEVGARLVGDGGAKRLEGEGGAKPVVEGVGASGEAGSPKSLAPNPKSLDATAALEAEIDRLVYRLYGLTAEEIAVVEGAR